MSALGAARADLAALLDTVTTTELPQARVTVTGHVPEELEDVHIVLQPAPNPIAAHSEYHDGSTDWVATFEVYLLICGQSNRRVHELVDDTLSAVVITALGASNTWSLVEGSISKVQTFTTSQWQADGVSLSVSCHLDPEE